MNSPPFKNLKSENAVHKGDAVAHPEVMALSTGWSFTGLCYIWRGFGSHEHKHFRLEEIAVR